MSCVTEQHSSTLPELSRGISGSQAPQFQVFANPAHLDKLRSKFLVDIKQFLHSSARQPRGFRVETSIIRWMHGDDVEQFAISARVNHHSAISSSKHVLTVETKFSEKWSSNGIGHELVDRYQESECVLFCTNADRWTACNGGNDFGL